MHLSQVQFFLFLIPAALISAGNPSFTIETIETNEVILNATLDVDADSISYEWEITLQPSLLEYYQYTSELIEGGEAYLNTCAQSFSQLPDAPALSNVEGIWVSCENAQDLAPSISYTMRQLEGFRFLNISYYLHHSGILRLTVLAKCYDYSKSSTGSDCVYVPVANEGGWQHLSYTVEEETVSFLRFTIEMVVREKNDFVLIDKVKASVNFPCGEEGFPDCPAITTTTPPPPTTTFKPPFTNRTMDTLADARSKEWAVSCTSMALRWFEYYEYINTFLYPEYIFNSCSEAFEKESLSTSLYKESGWGIWVACKDPELDLEECSITSRAPCHPFIRFRKEVNPNEAIERIQITYFLYGKGTIRLILSSTKCIDYSSSPIPNSLCEFNEAPGNPEHRWMNISYVPELNDFIKDFQIDLIAKDDHDFVLIDKVHLKTFEA